MTYYSDSAAIRIAATLGRWDVISDVTERLIRDAVGELERSGEAETGSDHDAAASDGRDDQLGVDTQGNGD